MSFGPGLFSASSSGYVKPEKLAELAQAREEETTLVLSLETGDQIGYLGPQLGYSFLGTVIHAVLPKVGEYGHPDVQDILACSEEWRIRDGEEDPFVSCLVFRYFDGTHATLCVHIHTMERLSDLLGRWSTGSSK
jgi:hypothetical protein